MKSPRSEHNLFNVDVSPQFGDAAVAIIVLTDGRYLMQLRDDKPGIFYPNHWGLFGGGIEEGETPEAALYRELHEELNLVPHSIRYFTRQDLDFTPFGGRTCFRMFYEVLLDPSVLPELRLGEGRQMLPVDIVDLLLNRRVVPYDSFALWMHAVHKDWAKGNKENTGGDDGHGAEPCLR